MKVNSSQFNYQYGDQIHFPYSIASLITYIQSKPELSQNFQFEKTFVLRDNLDEYIQKCHDTDILLCSCYVWNWAITNHLASAVKKINPNCMIIFGGPQIPDLSADFFKLHPFVDMIVHGEGEKVLEEIFSELSKNKDFSKIKGIETKDFRNPMQERIDNLDELPSPYLTNTVWNLVDKIDGLKWIASWETNRGCPYQCTFCDWGSATFTKVRKWEESRLFKEIEWFADNQIPYIDCCDANFGIFQERDFRIAEKLKQVSLEKHFPERIRPAWAKNSSEKIIPIAKQLQEGNILGAVTLAVQSLDTETLSVIKRANIKFDTFGELTKTFRDNNIPTYTEIIMGLPGETLETYKQGLENIAFTKIDSVFIYHCSVLPNAPMNVPEYRKKYGIKTVKSPIMLVHSSVHNRGIQEYEEIITECTSCPQDDLKEIYLFSWSFLTLQSLGVLEHITNFYNSLYNIGYMKFFEIFLDFCRQNHDSIFTEEYNKVIKFRDNGYAGKGWDEHDPKIGEIIWPIEEASWLRITFDKYKLISDTIKFLDFLETKLNLKTNKDILKDLSKFQVFMLTTRDNKNKIKTENFEFDWKDYFVHNSKLSKKNIKYYYNNLVTESDEIKWGYKTIWYGRRSRDYKCQFSDLKIDESNISSSHKPIDSNNVFCDTINTGMGP